MNLFSAFFAMLRRLTTIGNALADNAEAAVADFEGRVIPAQTPLLTTVDHGADTATSPASNGKVRVK